MSKGFVVYRDNFGWFRWIPANEWDNPYKHRMNREEIARCETLTEAKDIRHAYNMMVHGKPTQNDTFNRMLERKGAQS